jgi:hypothetical protein
MAPRWRRDEGSRGDPGRTDVAFGHALRQIGPTARHGRAARVRKGRSKIRCRGEPAVCRRGVRLSRRPRRRHSPGEWVGRLGHVEGRC